MQYPIRVAIADDDEVIRKVISHFFGQCPDVIVVAAVEDGRAAVQLASEGRIDVLILDLDMPGMGGAEAFGHIRALAPDVRVIIHSGRPACANASAFLQAGATAYLQKPCDFQYLLDAMKEAAGFAVTLPQALTSPRRTA
jgi:DNA-binding NarL/FixJ family response regulator